MADHPIAGAADGAAAAAVVADVEGASTPRMPGYTALSQAGWSHPA